MILRADLPCCHLDIEGRFHWTTGIVKRLGYKWLEAGWTFETFLEYQ